jgi:hypothetical protein
MGNCINSVAKQMIGRDPMGSHRPGVGIVAKPLNGNAVQPVGELFADGAISGDDWQATDLSAFRRICRPPHAEA